MAEKWERQEGESAKQYAYFKMFLDLGALRTIPKVQEKTNKSLTYLNTLSSRNNWIARADAYDRYIDEITRKENIEAIKKTNKENIQLAQAIKFVVGKKAKLLIDKIKAAGENTESLNEVINEISWNVLPQLANMAVEIERKAYGMNEEILKISIGDNSGIDDIEVSISLKKAALREKLMPIEDKNNPQKDNA
ncbi:hypothetical protein GWP40_08565 [Treponema vincentii]|uniref:hypothetical protein n=1 Tax=Treponema vincentii TaxID=69710 RepID=UPI001BB03FE3|nr:hypothetical protein [Treponema vincentii]QUY18360.1 hypothetical protein GWP40_08565 [Treponema vincentii]